MVNKEIRKIENNIQTENRNINGYSVVFNSLSENLGGFKEIISPDAIDIETIKRSDIFALLNHDDNKVLARSKYGKGSLELTIDEKGLRYSFDAPNTDAGNEVVEFIKRGDIDTSSFAFTVKEDRFLKNENGEYIRTIEKIDKLFDCSPVFSAAYSQSSVEIDCRSFNDFKEEEEEKEKQKEIELKLEEERQLKGKEKIELENYYSDLQNKIIKK